jgi:hypothetical protein
MLNFSFKFRYLLHQFSVGTHVCGLLWVCAQSFPLSPGLLLSLKKHSPVYAESWAKWLPKWPPVENPFQKRLLNRA